MSPTFDPVSRGRLISRCPTCGAGFTRSEWVCRECGHVLQEIVALKLVMATADDVREQFGRYPTFERLLVPVEEPIPEGTLVMLRILLPPGWGEMMVPSRVVAMVHTPSTPATPYRLQLELLQVDRDKQGRVKAIIVGDRPPPAQSADAEPVSPENAPETPGPVTVPFVPPPVADPAQEEVEIRIDELLEPFEPAEPAPPPPPFVVERESWLARERPQAQLTQALTEFVIRLTKSLTATSYYEPEHQAALQARIGLYDAFKMLVHGSPEITLLNQTTDVRRSVLVYGVYDEPMDLERVMVRSQADLFVPKLVQYLEKKALLSVSFKRALEHGEFHRFVDVLAAQGQPGRTDPRELTATLAAQRIENISVVFKEELVSKRKLSWRVAVALTRLKKDLSVLPLFEGRTAEDLRRVRYEVFRDVIRPLKQVAVLRELLVNCDLVAQEVKDLSEAEMEALIVEAISPEALPELLTGFSGELVENAAGGRAEHLIRLTQGLARTAARSENVVEKVFRDLFERQVLPREDLPPALQDRVRLEEKADRFLDLWKSHLPAFDAVTSSVDYQRHLDFFQRILPELLRRHQFDVVNRIALLIARHRVSAEGFSGRQGMAAAWLSTLSSSDAGTEIAWQLLSADKLRREALLTLCGGLGESAVPILFKALCDCPTRSIRLELCELLTGLKEPTSRFLESELDKKGIPWYFQRNLLYLLGRVGDRTHVRVVGRFLTDRHPRVRLEALLTICTLEPADAEQNLLRGLRDSDPDIRNVALRQLIQRRSTAVELFDHLRTLLAQVDPAGEESARQVCLLLGTYEAGEGYDQAVDLLVGVLQEDEKKGLWFMRKIPAAGSLKLAACQVLGRLRARRAAGTLSRLAEGKDPALKQSAARALRLIQEAERI